MDGVLPETEGTFGDTDDAYQIDRGLPELRGQSGSGGGKHRRGGGVPVEDDLITPHVQALDAETTMLLQKVWGNRGGPGTKSLSLSPIKPRRTKTKSGSGRGRTRRSGAGSGGRGGKTKKGSIGNSGGTPGASKALPGTNTASPLRLSGGKRLASSDQILADRNTAVLGESVKTVHAALSLRDQNDPDNTQHTLDEQAWDVAGEGVRFENTQNLFDSTGRKTSMLIDVVRQAATQNKFDSTSTLLASADFTAPSAQALPRPPKTLDTPSKPSQQQGQADEGLEKGTKPQKITDLTVHDLTPAGFDSVGPPPSTAPDQTQPEQSSEPVCFGCWSQGEGKHCRLHEDATRKLAPAQSMVLCKNWDLEKMRRTYRSEELQEVFERMNSSLRYDHERRAFLSVMEEKHAMYRALSVMQKKYNFFRRLWSHGRNWLRSLGEQLRVGKIKPEISGQTAFAIREKRRKWWFGEVCEFSAMCLERHPKPPVTGSSLPELRDELHILVDHQEYGSSEWIHCVMVEPLPQPEALYLPREYILPAHRAIPFPLPSYDPDTSRHPVANEHIDSLSPAAWLEVISRRLVIEAQSAAISQMETVSPMPFAAELASVKYPPPVIVKFALVGRKATPGNMADGGLPMEFITSALVTTYIPPQYGNYMVMNKSPVMPDATPEATLSFRTVQVPPVNQVYVDRPVQHPLNTRKAPTIQLCTKLEVDERHRYGENRPEQTGEQLSHGFRTSAWAKALISATRTGMKQFTPTSDVVSLNSPNTQESVTTHADRTYPFCEPSTRDNTTLDFYHLCLVGMFTSNKEQFFTAITVQEPGKFLMGANANEPLGPLVAAVYRSWAFTQRDLVNQYETDDGVDYWYNRKTGEAFWERPLAEAEQVPIKEGGQVLEQDNDDKPSFVQAGEEGMTPEYTQQQIRATVTRHHETEKEAVSRRMQANTSARWAREAGTLVGPPESGRASDTQSDAESQQSSVNSESETEGTSSGGEQVVGTTTAASADAAAVALEAKDDDEDDEDADGAVDVQDSGSGVLAPGDEFGGPAFPEPDSEVDRSHKLSALEKAQQLTMVPTRTPDEVAAPDKSDKEWVPRNAEEAVRDTVPVVAHPRKNQAPPDYETHPPAGVGEDFVPLRDYDNQKFVPDTEKRLRSLNNKLPPGFFKAIESPHVAEQYVDYLPHVPNLPTTRSIGRVKPRAAATDWEAVIYNPWTAGRPPLNVERVESLSAQQGEMVTAVQQKPGETAGGDIEVGDPAGMMAQDEENRLNARMEEDFKLLCSHTRHGNYQDVKETIEQPDWSLPIDYQDDRGNTLLHIACQNGNKRIVKLCLTRGSNINIQNLQGQTPLHFAQAYDYPDLGDYLVDKGADPTILNADGLTPYEGLSADAVNEL